MQTTTSAFASNAAFTFGFLLITVSAVAQAAPPPTGGIAQPFPIQPTTGGMAQPSAVSGPAPRPTSSNPWATLPRMSADRCLAEAVGTAADPNTGAPVRTSVDPQTGKPLCPTVQPSTETKPPR
jgi:hypothetical protein